MTVQPIDLSQLLNTVFDDSSLDLFDIIDGSVQVNEDHGLLPGDPQMNILQNTQHSELSVDDIQKILDLPSSALFDLTHQMQQPSPGNYSRNRTISSCSMTPLSPERGISCFSLNDGGETNSPMMLDVQSPVMNDIRSPLMGGRHTTDDQSFYSGTEENYLFVTQPQVQVPALQFNVQTSVGNIPESGFVGTGDFNSLLQLADESEKLLQTSELELSKMSPMTSINNPLLGQSFNKTMEQIYSPNQEIQPNKNILRPQSIQTLNDDIIMSTTQPNLKVTQFINIDTYQKTNLINTQFAPNQPTPNFIKSGVLSTNQNSPVIVQKKIAAKNQTNNSSVRYPKSSFIVQNNSHNVNTINTPNNSVICVASEPKQSTRVESNHVNDNLPSEFLFPGSLTLSNENISPSRNVNQLINAIKVENIAVKQEPDIYICYVCGEKASKHSYYGGQVCASCRAFFRRSVQSKYFEIFSCKKDKHCMINSETRKSCQFCRFKKCLESGMKPSWVLSDEERNRRFNKFNKVNLKTVSKENNEVRKNLPVTLAELYMTFTLEENMMLEDIQQKFQTEIQKFHTSSLQNLLLLDRNAGVNLIEASFQITPLTFRTYQVMEKAFQIYFLQNIVPQFTQDSKLTTKDISQITGGDNGRIAHQFKISQCLKMKDNQEEKQCPMSKQVNAVTSNQDIVDSLNLTPMMEKLSLINEKPHFPSYEELFSSQWANNKTLEERHKEIVVKIQKWPKDENDKFDSNQALLMTLILLFNADFKPIVNQDVVENIQMKYTLLLQRYLRSKLSSEEANKKFLEAMLLLSYTKEVWEMNKSYL